MIYVINNLRSWAQPMVETSWKNSMFLLAETLLICTVYKYVYHSIDRFLDHFPVLMSRSSILAYA